MLHREMQFGDLVLPVGLVADVATLPEYRGQGCATALLEAARQMLIRQGAVAGLAPHRFAPLLCAARLGRVRTALLCDGRTARDPVVPAPARSRASAELPGSCSNRACRKTYNIRLWRQVEQAALTRLYNENTQHAYGPLVRTETYWQWLVRRGGNERIYVAIDGPDRFELDESLSPIVGYAATREGRILEMMCCTRASGGVDPVVDCAPAGMPSSAIFTGCVLMPRPVIRCTRCCWRPVAATVTTKQTKAWCSWPTCSSPGGSSS